MSVRVVCVRWDSRLLQTLFYNNCVDPLEEFFAFYIASFDLLLCLLVREPPYVPDLPCLVSVGGVEECFMVLLVAHKLGDIVDVFVAQPVGSGKDLLHGLEIPEDSDLGQIDPGLFTEFAQGTALVIFKKVAAALGESPLCLIELVCNFINKVVGVYPKYCAICPSDEVSHAEDVKAVFRRIVFFHKLPPIGGPKVPPEVIKGACEDLAMLEASHIRKQGGEVCQVFEIIFASDEFYVCK